MNQDFIVIDLRELREARERQIAGMEARIAQRRHNVKLTERYIRLFGRCFTKEKLNRLNDHAAEVHRSIFEMVDALEELRCKPLH